MAEIKWTYIETYPGALWASSWHFTKNDKHTTWRHGMRKDINQQSLPAWLIHLKNCSQDCKCSYPHHRSRNLFSLRKYFIWGCSKHHYTIGVYNAPSVRQWWSTWEKKDFWNTRCGPCRKPTINRTDKRFWIYILNALKGKVINARQCTFFFSFSGPWLLEETKAITLITDTLKTKC